MKIYHVVSALMMTSEQRILLVKQKRPDRSDTDFYKNIKGDFFWTFPGGKVEQGESDAQALVREVLEETDMVFNTAQSIARCVYSNPKEDWICDARLFVIADWVPSVTHHGDPCEIVVDTDVFPQQEALEKIAMIPWLCMREPLTSYIHGDTDYKIWTYLFGDDGQCVPIAPNVFSKQFNYDVS
jgi:8-oxo-dGTP pyrophosphatase MutT (NUDIX family)